MLSEDNYYFYKVAVILILSYIYSECLEGDFETTYQKWKNSLNFGGIYIDW